MLTGENGIIAKAKMAKEQTLKANEKELADIAIMESITGSTGETVPYVPEGVTSTITGNLETGVKMTDSNNNEWSWVEVPKSITEDATNEAQIATALQGYASAYRNGGSSQSYDGTDTYYSGCGYDSTGDYETDYNKMLNSIKTNGGFWISSYEIGDSTATENWTVKSSNSDSGTPVSKANQVPYTCVTCNQAQGLAKQMATGTYTSSLPFGIQWDLVCKFLEEKTELTEADIKTDSKDWGNYLDSSLKLKAGSKYSLFDSSPQAWQEYNSTSNNVSLSSGNYITNANKSYRQLLTTGASDDECKMGIYDFAGNVWEVTLEFVADTELWRNCVYRGGSYVNSGKSSANQRGFWEAATFANNVGFRVVLY